MLFLYGSIQQHYSIVQSYFPHAIRSLSRQIASIGFGERELFVGCDGFEGAVEEQFEVVGFGERFSFALLL